MNETELRSWLEARNLKDRWWAAVDGAILDEPVGLNDVVVLKRRMSDSLVALMHASLQGEDRKWETFELDPEPAAAAPEPAKPVSPADEDSSERADDQVLHELSRIRSDVHDLTDVVMEVRRRLDTIPELQELDALARQLKGLVKQLQGNGRGSASAPSVSGAGKPLPPAPEGQGSLPPVLTGFQTSRKPSKPPFKPSPPLGSAVANW